MSSKHKVYVLQFNPEHFNLIMLKPTERRLLDAELLTSRVKEAGVAHTLMVDGRILAVLGFFLSRVGVATVFVIPSVYVYDYPVQTVRHTLRMFREVEKLVKPLHRLESMGYDDPEIDNWMTLLGFTCEGVHPQWSSQKDTFKTWARYVK